MELHGRKVNALAFFLKRKNYVIILIKEDVVLVEIRKVILINYFQNKIKKEVYYSF